MSKMVFFFLCAVLPQMMCAMQDKHMQLFSRYAGDVQISQPNSPDSPESVLYKTIQSPQDIEFDDEDLENQRFQPMPIIASSDAQVRFLQRPSADPLRHGDYDPTVPRCCMIGVLCCSALGCCVLLVTFMSALV